MKPNFRLLLGHTVLASTMLGLGMAIAELPWWAVFITVAGVSLVITLAEIDGILRCHALQQENLRLYTELLKSSLRLQTFERLEKRREVMRKLGRKDGSDANRAFENATLAFASAQAKIVAFQKRLVKTAERLERDTQALLGKPASKNVDQSGRRPKRRRRKRTR